MVAIPNMNWMGNEPSGSAYDVYRWYLGGGNPNATPGGGGGGGITQAYQPGGDGLGQGALQVGDPMMNASNFYKRGWDAWQNKNNPTLKDSFFGFPTQRQDVNPADAGFYVGNNMQIPQALTKAGKMQAGWNKTKSGIGDFLSNFKGPISGILSAVDKFHTLSPTDQQFIEMNMGYTGPTVFGENTSGLSKDPFGLNVRSAFGNYAERVGVEADKLGTALTKSAAKRGLTFDPRTGKVTGGTDDEIEAWQKQTKMLNKKFNFYTNMNKQKNFNEKIYKQNQEVMKKDVARVQANVDKDERKINELAKKGKATGSVNPHVDKSYSGGNPNPHTDTGWSGSSKSSSSKSSGSSYSRGDYGGKGHHWAEGGMVDADLSKDPEYLGWKKVYKMNPELGSMHEKHPTFIKFYKKHERDQKKFGGLAGLLYG